MKKVNYFMLLSLLIVPFIFVGCTGGSPPITSPSPTQIPEQSCTEVYIVSNCPWIFGTVFVNGIAHGEQLQPGGSTAVLVNRPQIRCGDIVSVYIQHPAGFKTRILSQNAIPPRTIFTFECQDWEGQGMWPVPLEAAVQM